MNTIWHVRLCNGPILVDTVGRETRRFRSHKVGGLLAYLALNLDRPCLREELYEALWPEEEPLLVANRFRVALASLRRQLEPEGVAFGTVLDVSEPGRVRLRAQTVSCDIAECERLLQNGDSELAARRVTGPLLPGFYEEWAIAAQNRYAMLAEDRAALLTAPFSHSCVQMPATTELPVRFDMREPAQAASSASPPVTHHNALLPLYLTGFFGRQSELQELHDLVRAHRQVSLVGMGGMGKTRLAAAFANAWEGESRFVSLVSLPDAGRLYDVVLQASGIAPQTDSPPEEQLIRVLNRRGPLLLILDNAEHLSDAVAEMTLRLLGHVPNLRLLVTSRQRLNIAGEKILLLAPLEAPTAPANAERLLEFAAVSFFVDRAKNGRPDFALTARNAPAVVDICRRLEGIPLALELAAARIAAQTPQQIAQGLDAGLIDLKSRQHGLSPRHESLRAVIQGSLGLLSPSLQDFFCALSVFQGGWSGEAARAVTDCEEVGERLVHLIRCSLVGVHEDERLGVMRYALLDTLRQFAAESLPPEMQTVYQERHARFYMDLAAHADEEDFRFMDRLEADHENLLLAMEWGWKHDRAALLLILQDILNMWANRGHHRLALEWIARVRMDHTLLARQYRQGVMSIYIDVGRYEEAEKFARLAGQKRNDPLHTTWVNACRGYVRLMQGVWEEAVTYQRRALEAAQGIAGEQRDMIVRLISSNVALTLLGRAEYYAANSDPAQDFREAEQYTRSGYAGLPEGSRFQASYYHHLMCALWGQNRNEEGDECFARALQIALAHRHLTTLIRVLGDGAFRLAAKGFPGESVQLLSAAESLREKMGCRAAPYFEARVREHLHALQTRLGNESFNVCRQSGLYTPPEVLVSSLLPQILFCQPA